MTGLLLLSLSAAAAPAVPTLAEAVAEAPHGVTGLVLVEPFTLGRGYAYAWRADRPELVEGTVIVVQIAPAMAVPRAVGQPVLYVGDTPAERVSWGPADTRLLVVVPGRPDLAVTPVYFGGDTLPEQVDAQRGAAELRSAVAAGEVPFAAAEIAAATVAPTRYADRAALQRHLADLLDEHCPDDAARGEGWRLPISP